MARHSDSGVKFQLLSEPEKGACPARQKGLENAEGDFLSFFDSDDVMRPTLLEKASEALRKSPESDIVTWKCRIIKLGGKEYVPPFLMGNPVESHLIHTLLRPQGYLVRKDFITKQGGWTKKIGVWNDFELGLRLLLGRPSIVTVDEVLADIYSQKDSITGLDFSSKEGLWEKTLLEMEKDNKTFLHPLNARIQDILDYRKSILAAHYYREGNIPGAKALYQDTIKGKPLKKVLPLGFSYHFTRLGFRGAWRLMRFFI